LLPCQWRHGCLNAKLRDKMIHKPRQNSNDRHLFLLMDSFTSISPAFNVDCCSMIIDPLTNATVVNDVIRFVSHNTVDPKSQLTEDLKNVSGPIFTSVLPRLSPLNKLTKALGAFSKPSKILSFHFILPSLIHLNIEALNSFKISL
jgi:hypothetical protein